MAGYSDSVRVLVVDDAADIRAVTRRVLTSRGYHVDVAGTLAEARVMAPTGYDAVIIDMHLGSERGSTLVEELTAADPGFASRCLMMSGSGDGIPSGVATLAKPFLADQLLGAVGALHETRPKEAECAGADRGLGAPSPSPSLATKRQPETGTGPAQALLDMVALLRERERGAFADALHDRPVQDLGAAVLGLYEIRQEVPAGQRELLDLVTTQVNAAAQALRGLMGQYSAAWLEEPPEETIRKRTGWLLAAPPAVDIHPSAGGMSQETAGFVASVAELVLFLASGAYQPHARIHVRETARTVDIETTIVWAPGDARRDDADAASRESLLAELGSALGSDIDLATDQGELRLRVSLGRRAGRYAP
jgi:CheY-like chemotaxis protein